MTKLSKLKKLTRIDVLIVVFMCLLILPVLLPALYKARITSSRIKCGKNLVDIGRAMRIYADDYDGEFPRAGGSDSIWSGRIVQWMAKNRYIAYGLQEDGSKGAAAITSSLYLLLKYAGVSPKSFVCPGDKGTTEFKPSEDGVRDSELVYLWDFGPKAETHCSYSYHMPYGLYALTTSSDPGMAVAADRNPWIASPTAEGKYLSLLSSYNPNGRRKETNVGNAITHQEDGQNVLFMDTHVGFEKRSFCGINDDNIYTYWNGGDIRRGGLPIPGLSQPEDGLDSFLVHDPPGPKYPAPILMRHLQEEADN